MASGAGSPPFHSFSDDLREDRSANPLELLSRNCSNVQILQLGKYFRQYTDGQILSWVEDYRCRSPATSSSDRNSLFSVLSGISQATTLSNQSNSQYASTERLKLATHPQLLEHTHRQDLPIQEPAEATNQYSLVPTIKNPPAVPICIACNVNFTETSSLSRHYQQHCERKFEWSCQLCVPTKSFYRKEKLLKHHVDHHGLACFPGCYQRKGGLCKFHLPVSTLRLPDKKAWGCPCCLRWFNSWDSWIKHGAHHPVENGKVVGWSLSKMVESLLFQPFLAEAISRSPLPGCDLTKVRADVFQNLREALERHKLPDVVQAHYDYRALQPPEALALYAFRLVTYGEPFLDDISITTTAVDGGHQAANPLQPNRFESQSLAPTIQNVSIPPVFGYWNPEDPFNYSPKALRLVESATALDFPMESLSGAASSGNSEARSSNVTAQCMATIAHAQLYGQSPQAASAPLPSQHTMPMQQVFGNPGRSLQETRGGEKGRGRALSMKKPWQNLVHRPSSSKCSSSQTDNIPSVPAIPDVRAPDRNRTAATLEYGRESTRIEPLETVPNSPGPARLSARMSGRMSGIQWDTQWDALVTWHPDEQHEL